MSKYIRNPIILLDFNNRTEAKPLEPMIDTNNNDIVIRGEDEISNISISNTIKQRLYREGYGSTKSNQKRYIFGMVINMNESDPNSAISYTMDNKLFTPISINDDGICNYGNWKEVLKTVFGLTPCIYDKEKSSIIYLDMDDYEQLEDGGSIDISDKNIVIEFKRTYYKIEFNNNLIIFKIANYQVDTTYESTAFISDKTGDILDNIYLSAYPSNIIDDTLSSISGNVINKNINFNSLTEKGINSINYSKYLYLNMITMLLTKSTAINNIASKVSTDDIISGSLNKSGLFAKSTNSYKILGIEYLFGGYYLNGIKSKDGKLVYMIAGYYGNDKKYKICKNINNREGYISSYISTNGIIIPGNLSGSSNTYFKMILKSNSSNSNLYVNESGYYLNGEDNSVSLIIGVFE